MSLKSKLHKHSMSYQHGAIAKVSFQNIQKDPASWTTKYQNATSLTIDHFAIWNKKEEWAQRLFETPYNLDGGSVQVSQTSPSIDPHPGLRSEQVRVPQ